jgi:hypothetical protein
VEVLVEAWVVDRWEQVGSLSEIEPPGSLSWMVNGCREVYVFGVLDDCPGVWRSIGGVDLANAAVRELYTQGLEQLSDLTEPYQLPVDDGGRQVRFSLVR